ncbi:hypothetical protein ATANTOWER_015086 [Ataeniobius toweri]|uniref:Uncharacterized protein n=1 Tax=Ataeniobius toweri TaxID=208326 RepID=A0ABU7A1I4_9TELE|nr:hypothetical protein [Ataeniobius toweri]
MEYGLEIIVIIQLYVFLKNFGHSATIRHGTDTPTMKIRGRFNSCASLAPCAMPSLGTAGFPLGMASSFVLLLFWDSWQSAAQNCCLSAKRKPNRFTFTSFSIKICNSEREKPQTCPSGPGTSMEEIPAIDIKWPPRAQEPKENHCRDYCNPPEKSMGESQENHPAATVEKPQGAAASPRAPLAALYTRADPAMDPEACDPGTYHSPSRGPTEPRCPGPGKQPPGVSRSNTKAPSPGHRQPQIHQQAEIPTTGREEVGPTQEREQSKTQPDTKNMHTQSQSYIPTLMRTHKNTHTQAPNIQVPIPHRGIQPLYPGGGPLPSRAGDKQTDPAPEPGRASLGWCLNLSNPDPDPDPTPRPQSPTTSILIRRGGHGHTLTAHRDGKARAPRNATPASTHRRNRADTTKHCAQNRTPDPTPRWGKLIWQEVPGPQQAPGAGIPHYASRIHTNTPHHCHCNNSPGRNIIQLSYTIAA